MLICGGRGGVMEAASRGAAEAGGTVIGVLPTLSPADANPYVTHAVATGIGEARNLAVVASGEAVIAVGGEWGTLSEIASRAQDRRPVVDPPGAGPCGSGAGHDLGVRRGGDSGARPVDAAALKLAPPAASRSAPAARGSRRRATRRAAWSRSARPRRCVTRSGRVPAGVAARCSSASSRSAARVLAELRQRPGRPGRRRGPDLAGSPALHRWDPERRRLAVERQQRSATPHRAGRARGRA